MPGGLGSVHGSIGIMNACGSTLGILEQCRQQVHDSCLPFNRPELKLYPFAVGPPN